MRRRLGAGTLSRLRRRCTPQEILAGHRRGLLQANDCQQGWRNVGEPAIRESGDPGRWIDENERDRVGCMRGMRLSGLGIAHHLDVAMIGGDQQRTACALDRPRETPETKVDRLDRLDRRLEVAGMADHIGVGVVEDDDLEAAGRDRFEQPVGDFEGGHLGFQIVGRDLGRRDENALLAGERRLPSAVEEKSNMRVFFGLGDAQLGGIA